MNAQNRWLLIFPILAAGCAGLIYLHYPLGFNQSLYHYQGLVLKEGGLPYLDFVEKKGPMGLLFYGLGAVFFGPTPIAYRVFDLLVLVTTGLFLYFSIAPKKWDFLGFVVVTIWLIHSLIEGPGNTGDVTNLITLCLSGTYFLISGNKQHKLFPWLAGILLGMACWVKPTALIMFVPLFFLRIGSLPPDESQNRVVQLIKVLAGATLVSVCFLLYLWLSGSWQGFWEVVVLDPLLNYVDDRSRLSWRVIKRVVSTFLNDPIFRVGGAIGLLLGFFNGKVKSALFFGSSIMLSIIIEGKLFPYQFTPLYIFLAVGLYHLIRRLQDHSYQKKFIKNLLYLSTVALFIYPLGPIAFHYKKLSFSPFQKFDQSKAFLLPDFQNFYTGREALVGYLKLEMSKDETLYVLGVDPNVYIDLQKTTACRFIREAPMLTQGLGRDDDPAYLVRWQNEMMQFLQKDTPDWLAIDHELPGGDFKPINEQKINAILDAEYGPGKILGRYILYRRNE